MNPLYIVLLVSIAWNVHIALNCLEQKRWGLCAFATVLLAWGLSLAIRY